MDKKEFISKLNDIEWEDFEVKEAQGGVPQSSWATVSAFSNTAGGWLVFGVKRVGRKFEIIGLKNPELIEQNFLTTLRAGKFNKTITVESKKYDLEGKKILSFYIPQKSSRDKPIYFNSKANTFIRTGSGDQRATSEEIDAFYRNASFDNKDKELTNYGIKNLDMQTVKKYRAYFSSVRTGHPYLSLSTNRFLEKLGVLVDDKITYGGLLVFGKEEILSRELPQFRIDYLDILGGSYDSLTRYNDRLVCEKNLFESFFELYPKLVKKINIPFKLRKGFRDEDPPHLQAIREALVNLLIHTDYFSKANPRIRVFLDRIEFFNSGSLPKALKFILEEDFSLPRNPVIAKIFRFVNLADNIGSGFTKMISGWKSNYKLNPVIDGDFDCYRIIFPFRRIKHKPNLLKEDKKENILSLLLDNPLLTQKEIASHVGLSLEGVRYHIKKLKGEKGLKKEGTGLNREWKLPKKK